MTTTTAPLAQLDGYTLEQHPNTLARRGCWYVRHAATGQLIGWIALVNRTGNGEGDGWSALSFAHRDALVAADTPHDPYWWTGRTVWGDENRGAQDALEALVAATGDLWLTEQAEQARTRVRPPYRGPSSAEQDAELRAWAARRDYRSAARRRR